MKLLLKAAFLCSVWAGYSQGIVDLNTFSVPELINSIYRGAGEAQHTKGVRELHITYIETNRKKSFFFNENNQLEKMTDSFGNELRLYHYVNGQLEFIESRDANRGYKKPVFYDKKGWVFSHCEPTNVYGNQFIYYEYDDKGNIIKYWSENNEDLTASELKQKQPYKIFKYDDKGRLIENIGQFSTETYQYNIKGVNLEVTVGYSYEGKKPSISKRLYNQYGLDAEGYYSIDAHGNWTSRGGQVTRKVVYAQ